MKPSTLIKLSIALVLPTLVGCADSSPRWARAHAVQDSVTAADHNVAMAVRAVQTAAPANVTPAPVAEPVAAAKRAPHKSTKRRAVVPAEANLDADLGVKRLIIAHGVKGREPVAAADAFSSDAKRIYAFVEVSNPERAASAVFVSFSREGGPERGKIELRVGESSRWRTWAYTRLADKPGRYIAKVRDGRGRVLAKAPFEVKQADAAEAPVKQQPTPDVNAARDAQPAAAAKASLSPKAGVDANG